METIHSTCRNFKLRVPTLGAWFIEYASKLIHYWNSGRGYTSKCVVATVFLSENSAMVAYLHALLLTFASLKCFIVQIMNLGTRLETLVEMQQLK